MGVTMKSYIHFIRHGITEGNAKKWYYGWTDVPLLPEGVAALQNLCAQCIYPPLLQDNSIRYNSVVISISNDCNKMNQLLANIIAITWNLQK